MKLSWNVIAQIIGVALQYVNIASGLIPKDWEWLVAAVIGILQGIAGIASHFSNPDGTPAKVAYVPK
jgi:hypothetical protein